MQLSCTLGWVLALALFVAAPSRAVIIATGDGTGNTSAPLEDPGWSNVGTRTTGLSVVYLGNGWVLTANHVGAGDVVLAGQTYALIPGTEHRILNPDSTPADLVMFRIAGLPALPVLPIADALPKAPVVPTLIGAGMNRGPETRWRGITGYLWGNGTTMRWGTALVTQTGVEVPIAGGATRTFATAFAGGSSYPAGAALGDSGGAGFVKVKGTWMLAGIMVAVDRYDGQPVESILLDNHTYLADLTYYRDQIVSRVASSCGLGFELVLILPPLQRLYGRRKRASAG